MGSMEEARRAGTKHASAAAATRMSVTPARIHGFRELSLTHLVANLLNAKHKKIPGCDASSDIESRRGKNHAEDVASFRAEGHADTEFIGAGGDAVRDDAIKPNRGEQERKNRENAEQNSHETLLCHTRGGS